MGLETEQGHKIVTERLSEGSLTWEVNPIDLDGRNSMAKMIRSADCGAHVTVREIVQFQQKLAEGSAVSSKFYSQAVYVRAANAKRGARAQLKLDISSMRDDSCQQ